MSRQVTTYFSILILFAAVVSSYAASGQSPACIDRQSRVPPAQKIKITVVDVEFSGDNPLSGATCSQLASRIKELDLSVARGENDSNWLAVVEGSIRDQFQQLGYFRAHPTITQHLVAAETQEQRYIVNVEIASGPQYRLKDIHVSGATVFAAAELKAQFSIHRGDLFDASKIRQGIEAVTRLYGRRGFIDVTEDLEMDIDSDNLLIDVRMKVEKGQQYRVRNVEISGLDPTLTQLLKTQAEPGQVFDYISFRNFFEEHKTGVRADGSLDDTIQVRRDGTNASVDLLVDFRPCPKT